METVTVNLGPRSYDIIIGINALNEAGTYLNAFKFTKSAVIITNTTVASLYLDRLADGNEVYRPSYPCLDEVEQRKARSTCAFR